MVQVKIEHVIVVLLGLFLLYHFLGSCGCNKVEGWITSPEQYMYQMPFILTNSQGEADYCGLSDQFKEFHTKATSPENYPERLKAAKESVDKAQEEVDQITSSITTLTKQKEEKDKAYDDLLNNPGDADPAKDTGTLKWDDIRAEYILKLSNAETAKTTVAQNLDKAQRSLPLSQTSLDSSTAAFNEELEEYLNELTGDFDEKQTLCDKPNRMLHRTGPQHACAFNISEIQGPDATEFWTKDVVKNLMRSGSKGKKFPTCQVRRDSVSNLTAPGQPFHGYDRTGKVGAYETAGELSPDLTDV